MMSYNKPGWEVVRLADSLSNTDTDDGISIIDKTYIPWCVDNVPLGGWAWLGVTKYSFRFQFMDKQDATAFRIRFGI